MFRHYSRLAFSLAALSFFSAGCVITPDPITGQGHADRSQQDIGKLQSAEFVPTKPIELHEAMARAVAHNLRYRVSQIERDIENAELEKSNFDLLPAFDVNVGRDRNSVKVTNSDDRITSTASATFAWNILDLGVSYARANQQADEVLISQERERKALQDIIRQVNAAFWRAAAGQRLLVKVEAMAQDLQVAMKASREMERTRATDVITAVAFRRDIVESVKQALSIRRELHEAKAELAELLNIRPGTDFELALPAMKASQPRLPMSVKNLEVFALENRPELRIEKYNERISDWQAREAFYNLLPGFNLSIGQNYSSDSNNLSANWISTGINMGMNLFKLFSGSSEIEIAEHSAELARRQRLALSAAVLTQVHMSRIKFSSAAQQMRLAHEIAESDRKLTRLVRTDGQFLNNDFFEAIRLATRQLQSEMDEQRSYVDLEAARADLMHAIGLDLLPDNVPFTDVAKLTNAIRAMMVQWDISDGTDDGTGSSPAPGPPLDQLVDSMMSKERRDDILIAAAKPPVTASRSGRREPADIALFSAGQLGKLDIAATPDSLLAGNTQAASEIHEPDDFEFSAPSAGALNLFSRAATVQAADTSGEETVTPETIERLNRIAPASQGAPAVTLPHAADWEFSMPPVKSDPVSAGEAQYLVQLGAFRSDNDAVDLFVRLTTEPLAALSGAKLKITYGHDEGGTDFFYVHTDVPKRKSTAEAICRSVKSAGQQCLVVRKRK